MRGSAHPRIHESAYVAPTAIVRGNVTIAEGAVIMFGAVIRAELDEIVIGARTNVQDNAVVHCDEGIPTVVGSDSTIGHAAVVHGATIGSGCLIGIGAMALNRSQVGDGSWLAAGSVLPEGREVAPGMLAVGAPARALRPIRPDESERQRAGVAEYLRLGELYRSTEA